jgi:hypothetical protein
MSLICGNLATRVAIGAALGALVLMLAIRVSTAPAWPQHRCGSFVAEHTFSDGSVARDRVTVFNGDGLSCRTATAVIEAFWGPEDQIHPHGGPSEAETYYTIRGFPGWRCYQGAGGGGCRHGGKLAAYLARNI